MGFNPFLVRASVYWVNESFGEYERVSLGFNPFLVRASVYWVDHLFQWRAKKITSFNPFLVRASVYWGSEAALSASSRSVVSIPS